MVAVIRGDLGVSSSDGGPSKMRTKPFDPSDESIGRSREQ